MLFFLNFVSTKTWKTILYMVGFLAILLLNSHIRAQTTGISVDIGLIAVVEILILSITVPSVVIENKNILVLSKGVLYCYSQSSNHRLCKIGNVENEEASIFWPYARAKGRYSKFTSKKNLPFKIKCSSSEIDDPDKILTWIGDNITQKWNVSCEMDSESNLYYTYSFENKNDAVSFKLGAQ